MKKILLLLILVSSITAQATVVSAFNIQWFGRGGEIEGNPSDEFRIERLKNYLATYLADTDVFAFSEIVNVQMLKRAMTNFNCYSYDETNLDHQHIVICARRNFEVTTGVIDSVRLGSSGLRPALVAKIIDPEGNQFNVVGLHLKARRENTAKRLQQVKNLLKDEKFSYPTIIAGDFNSFPKEETGLEQSDADIFSQEFTPYGFGQIGGDQNTYAFVGSRYRRTLDRSWTKGIEVVETKVIGPCNKNESVDKPYSNLRFYNRFISDHCPLTIRFNL